jgi:hypothetical protein
VSTGNTIHKEIMLNKSILTQSAPISLLTAALAALAALAACDPHDGAVLAGEPDRPMIDTSATLAEADPEFAEIVNDYMEAILSGDDESVRALLSDELLERLDSNNDGEVSGPELRSFASGEARKVTASLEGDVLSEGLTVERFKPLRGGQAAEVWLAHRGVALIKPQYLVLENGAWRWGSIALFQERATTSNYKVSNVTTKQSFVKCDGGKSASPAGLATAYIKCTNMKCGALTGTNFYYNGTHACDYNTWGVDFYLNGFGSCADDC